MCKCIGVMGADSHVNLLWPLMDSLLIEARGQNLGSLPFLLRPLLCHHRVDTCQPSHETIETRVLHRAGGAQREPITPDFAFVPSGVSDDGCVPSQLRVCYAVFPNQAALPAVPTATTRPQDGLQLPTLSPALSC